MASDLTELSSKKNIGDWKVTKPKLLVSEDSGVWKEVMEDFYYDRLKTRYLNPIEAIRNLNLSKGEGFAIVAIQCSLIEFMESCFQGTNYHHAAPAHWPCLDWLMGFFSDADPEVPTQKHTYKDSGKIFVSFLTKREPFKGRFNGPLAKDFYKSIRCGALHEARTKGKWLIWKGSGLSLIVDPDRPEGPVLYRDDFQDAIIRFIDYYRAEVPQNIELQQAFIRKFDHLCN